LLLRLLYLLLLLFNLLLSFNLRNLASRSLYLLLLWGKALLCGSTCSLL
jgi:hypothetical protein